MRHRQGVEVMKATGEMRMKIAAYRFKMNLLTPVRSGC
jgi:hypothetical protein